MPQFLNNAYNWQNWHKARQGKARQGQARQGQARQGQARPGQARPGQARHPPSPVSNLGSGQCLCNRFGIFQKGPCKARPGQARPGPAMLDQARPQARPGHRQSQATGQPRPQASPGQARPGQARPGQDRTVQDRTGHDIYTHMHMQCTITYFAPRT